MAEEHFIECELIPGAQTRKHIFKDMAPLSSIKNSARTAHSTHDLQPNLQKLLSDVDEISKKLASMMNSAGLLDRQSTLRSCRHKILPCRESGGNECVSAAEIRSVIKMRQKRAQFMDPTLFADPAWDMMLDLMAARLEGHRVSVSSLCIAAIVPATTALRWIQTLTEQGIFLRVPDMNDRRRVYIELSEKAVDAITGYFEAIQK